MPGPPVDVFECVGKVAGGRDISCAPGGSLYAATQGDCDRRANAFRDIGPWHILWKITDHRLSGVSDASEPNEPERNFTQHGNGGVRESKHRLCSRRADPDHRKAG